MNRIYLALAAGALALATAGAAQAQSSQTQSGQTQGNQAPDRGPLETQVAQVTSPPGTDARPGLYVRGSLGYAFSAEDEVDYSPLWGIGVGYRLDRNLRADVTIDWRDRFIVESGGLDTKVSNQSFMLNAYYDLDSIPIIQLPGGFKPYVGAGVGLSRIEINDQTIRPLNAPPGVVTRIGGDEYNIAWQVMAGVSYQLNQNFAADLGYRYAHIGEANISSTLGSVGQDLNTHEVVLTLRYGF